MNSITVTELKNRLNNGEQVYVIDVREPHEYEQDNLGAVLVPLSQLRNMDVDQIESIKNEEIIVHCKSGMRSQEACMILSQLGFANPVNLTGGIMEWRNTIGQDNL